jgi:peptide/nickel transport system permease protein
MIRNMASPVRLRFHSSAGQVTQVTRLILSRIAYAIPVIFVMTFLTFFLASLIPGNAAIVILGQDATAEKIHALNQALGLDKPIWVQYISWIGKALHGNLGNSLYTNQAITQLLFQRFMPTLFIGAGATLIAAVLGIALGMYASIRGGAISRALDILSMIGIALPNFWIALLLIVLISGKLHWLPSLGYTKFGTDPGDWLRHLVLPVVSLGLAGIALVAKQARNAYGDALSRDFMRFMQANGISRRSLLFRHGLRYASVPIASAVSVTFINLFGATAALETIFAIPGLGAATVQATLTHDLSIVQGTVLTYTLVIVVATLLTDVLYAFLNPKVGAR